jgi:hypothetical protein
MEPSAALIIVRRCMHAPCTGRTDGSDGLVDLQQLNRMDQEVIAPDF